MNTDENEIINNVRLMNRVFCSYDFAAKSAKEAMTKSKIMCKIYKYDTSDYGGKAPYFMLKYPQTIGKFYTALGIPAGKKVYTNPSVPKFILESNENITRAFLERVIINEGHVRPTIISIGHSTSKDDKKPPNLIINYIKMFNKLGIKTSKPSIMKHYITDDGNRRAYWRISITGRNLDVIRDSFNLHTKQKSIDKRTFQSRWKPHHRIEQILKEIHKKRVINTKEIASNLNVSGSLISLYSKDLEATGKVKKKKIGIRVFYESVS